MHLCLLFCRRQCSYSFLKQILTSPPFSVFIEYFVVGVFYLWWPSTNCGVLCTELILMCCRATPNTSPVFYNSPRDGCSPRCFGFKPLFLFSSGCVSYSFPIGDYCRQHQLSSFLSLSTEHLCMVELRANRHKHNAETHTPTLSVARR